MRTYTKPTTLENTEDLLTFAGKHNCPIFTKEGTLNDFHIVYNTCRIKVNNIRPRKYIILYYKFQNAWSNTLWQTHTDDLRLVIQFARQYGYENIKELKKELCNVKR